MSLYHVRQGPGCRAPWRKVGLGVARRGGNSLASPVADYCDHDRRTKLSRGLALPLFTESPRETVRKGCEQRSKRGFGRYMEHKMARRAPLWRLVRLLWERFRDFSDSFRRLILGNSRR